MPVLAMGVVLPVCLQEARVRVFPLLGCGVVGSGWVGCVVVERERRGFEEGAGGGVALWWASAVHAQAAQAPQKDGEGATKHDG